MIQKEVAERIAAGPGSKTYGILSVLLQAWYEVEYLFTVSENVFDPPPKVKSAVIRMVRMTENRWDVTRSFSRGCQNLVQPTSQNIAQLHETSAG